MSFLNYAGLVLFVFASCNQASEQEGTTQLRKKFTAAWSHDEPVPDLDGRIFIPGMKISIIPPEGCSLWVSPKSSQLRGDVSGGMTFDEYDYQHGNKWYPYSSKEDEENRKAKIIERHPIKISGYKGYFVEYISELHRFEILFGDSSFTVIVSGYCPIDSDTVAKRIKQAMETVNYHRDRIVDPFENTAVLFDYEKTIFSYPICFYGTYGFLTPNREDEKYWGWVRAEVEHESREEDAKWLSDTYQWPPNIRYKREITASDTGRIGDVRYYEEVITGISNPDDEVWIEYRFCATNGKRIAYVWAYPPELRKEVIDEYRKLTRTIRLKP